MRSLPVKSYVKLCSGLGEERKIGRDKLPRFRVMFVARALVEVRSRLFSASCLPSPTKQEQESTNVVGPTEDLDTLHESGERRGPATTRTPARKSVFPQEQEIPSFFAICGEGSIGRSRRRLE